MQTLIDFYEFVIFKGTPELRQAKAIQESAFKGGKVKKFELSEDEIIQEDLL